MYSPPEKNNNSAQIIFAILGLIGTIATGYFTFRASVGPTEISIGATQTAETVSARKTAIIYAAEATVSAQFQKTATPGFPHVVIENRLLRPVKIYIDNIYKNSLDNGEIKTFLLESFPTAITYETSPLDTSEEIITGGFSDVPTGRHLVIDNQVAEKTFYFAQIRNNTSLLCSIVVDEGLTTELHPQITLFPNSTVSLGYHRLFLNSNLVLHCDNDKNYFWGTLSGQKSKTTMFDLLEPDSGLFDVSINSE